MNGFKAGEWVVVEKGIGQVISCHDIHVEEFLSQFKTGKKVGEYLDTLVLYKVLCDHNGNERKRFLTTYSQCSGVTTAVGKVAGLVDPIRRDRPEIYEKFQGYRHKKPINHNYTAWLDVPEEEVEAIAARVTEFKQKFSDAFTYPDLMSYVISDFPALDVTSINKGYSRTHNNLGLVLFNDDLQRKGQRALFSGVNVFIK